MSAALKLFQLSPSPNNRKVRIALAYKGLRYESWKLEDTGPPPFDRSEVVRVSTQPRTPVLKHGDTVLFDSGAILRYLDANFPETPRLFTADYDAFARIEEWEWWARTELAEPIRAVFAQARAERPDPAVCARSSELLNERTGRIEGRLAEGPFLVGDALTAADVTAAAGLGLALLAPADDANPIFRFFRANLHLGPDRERTREWAAGILAYDRG